MATDRGRGLAVLLVLLVAAVVGAPAVSAQVTVPTVPGGTTTTTEPPEEPTTSTTAAATTTSEAEASTTSAVTDTTFAGDGGFTDAVTTTSGAAASTSTTARVAAPRRTRLSPVLSAAAVTGSFGVGIASVLGFAGVLVLFATHVRPGGTSMSELRRNRLLLGLGCLAVAAVVGVLGYLKLSLEPEVNRQIPYLASAGMALVLLSALGGALIVGEQLRADDRRIEELEAAVRTLAEAVAPSMEAPARIAPVEPPAAVEPAGAGATRRRR